MRDEHIDIVDDQDSVIGTTTKDEAQEKGLRHRVVRITLEDSAGNILLQKRHDDKELYPGCWDTAAAGHVDAGEGYLAAAERELYEELGVVTQLEQINYYKSNGSYDWRKLNRFTVLYRGAIPAETTLTLQEDEVADVRWISRTEIGSFIQNNPAQIADGLLETNEFLYKT
ncbi:NUDIX domain-containing protein [Candidatus Saccharibacteria bacterium]|nr:MAG: NUDIX domain-containing protein [Candidatus Saccharibacteria bacterium]